MSRPFRLVDHGALAPLILSLFILGIEQFNPVGNVDVSLSATAQTAGSLAPLSHRKKISPELKLITRSLMEYQGCPVRSMLLPDSWKLAERTGDDFYDGMESFGVLFKQPGADSQETLSINQTHNPRHDALYTFCNRGARTIYSRTWHEKSELSVKDPRYLQVIQDFRTLASAVDSSRMNDNQFLNEKNPRYLLDQVEVKRVGGKLVLAVDGRSIDQGKQASCFSRLVVPIHQQAFRNYCVSYSTTSPTGFVDSVAVNRIMSSITWDFESKSSKPTSQKQKMD